MGIAWRDGTDGEVLHLSLYATVIVEHHSLAPAVVLVVGNGLIATAYVDLLDDDLSIFRLLWGVASYRVVVSRA